MTEPKSDPALFSRRLWAALIDAIVIALPCALLWTGIFCVLFMLRFGSSEAITAPMTAIGQDEIFGKYTYTVPNQILYAFSSSFFMESFVTGSVALFLVAFLCCSNFELWIKALLPVIFLTPSFWSWLYHARMESSPRQATLGKLLMHILVCDADGMRLSFKKASLRHFAKVLSSPLCVGYFLATWRQDRRALHDVVTGCRVVNRDLVPEVRAGGVIWQGIAWWLVNLIACFYFARFLVNALMHGTNSPLAVPAAIAVLWFAIAPLLLLPLEVLRNLSRPHSDLAPIYWSYLACLERLPISKSRDFVFHLINAGVMYDRLGQYDKAEIAWQRALSLLSKPKDISAKLRGLGLTNMARLRLLQNNYSGALELASEALATWTKSTRDIAAPQLILAQACLGMNNLDQAKQYLEDCQKALTELNPSRDVTGNSIELIEISCWRVRGDLALAKEEFAEAERCYKESINLAGEVDTVREARVFAHYGLAKVYVKQGQRDMARQTYLSALEKASRLPETHPLRLQIEKARESFNQDENIHS
jgi:tetratricopeptide (TPR) repeat protein/uncharacterized RDD family membrane protein YckC